MEWLTREQVAKAAKKSRKAALECSREHWRQLSTATAKEMREYELDTNDDGFGCDYCACCVRFYYGTYRCSECPLKEHGYACEEIGSPWAVASDAYFSWSNSGGAAKWRAWKAASLRMYQVLLECK